MTLALPDDARKQALASLERFSTENLDGGLGELQAIGPLDLVFKEIGSSRYNAGVAAYWPKGTSVRRK